MDRAEFLLTVRLVLVTLLGISVLGINEVAHAQTPKFWNSATTPLNIELTTGPVISVDLQKWRTRYTLVVDAVVRAANATSGSLVATPTVNGLALDPSPSVATVCNGHCFVSARWVLDLDQANVDHPGVFTSNGTAGLPLTISLQGLKDHPPEIGSLLLTAKLEKKR
jgi:hypothetical protein